MPSTSFNRLAEALGNNDALIEALLRAKIKGSKKPTIHINQLVLKGGLVKKKKQKKKKKTNEDDLLSTVELNSIQRAWENPGSNRPTFAESSSLPSSLPYQYSPRNNNNNTLALEESINSAVQEIESLNKSTSRPPLNPNSKVNNLNAKVNNLNAKVNNLNVNNLAGPPLNAKFNSKANNLAGPLTPNAINNSFKKRY